MAETSLNINRAGVYEELVQKLAIAKVPDGSRSLFPTIRELLCFCALLGFSQKRKLPLDRSQGVEDVSYQQFERDPAALDLIYTIALADSENVELLKDGESRVCADIFEEYANGGLSIIKDYFVRNGGEYPDKALMALLKEKGFLSEEDAEPDLTSVF